MGFFRNLFKRSPEPGRPRPVTDDNFQRDVIESETPALVDFWASWCAPCKVMGGLLNDIGPEYEGRVNIFKLNVEQNPQTAVKFGIRSIPTMIIFKGGKQVERITGLMPLNPLRQLLNKVAG